MGTIKEYMEIPAPSSDQPGMFRCAEEGFMSDLFSRVGLQDITEKEVNGKLNCDSTETYWHMMTEVAAPIDAALSRADKATKEKIKNGVHEKVHRHYIDAAGKVSLDTSAFVVYGEK